MSRRHRGPSTLPLLAALCLGAILAPAASGLAAGEQETPGELPNQDYLDRLRLEEGWYARLETDKGVILIHLLPRQAPQSVAHFAALADGRLSWVDPATGEQREDPFYDGVLIHKVEPAQRFEAGDRTATGRGAPPLWVPQEGIGPVDFSSPWRVGMTRSSLGKISGVLFFVTAIGTPWLNGRHPCFGEVVGGQDIVREICSVDVMSTGQPRDPITIHRVRIFKEGDPPPLPEPEPFKPPSTRLQPKKTSG